MGKIYILLLLCFWFGVFRGEARPLEPEYDNEEKLIGPRSSEDAEADAEPALLLLKHMWQSVQELKRKQNSEDTPSFGQGLAQQLDVLRKLNRRQALRRRLEHALEDSEFYKPTDEAPPEDGVFSHAKMDPHFPSETKSPLLLILANTPGPQK